MAQIDQVLKKIIHRMALHRHHGFPFKLVKLDVKERFWRMAVANEDVWKFCYVLLSLKYCKLLDDIKLVVPVAFKCAGVKVHRSFAQGRRLNGISWGDYD